MKKKVLFFLVFISLSCFVFSEEPGALDFNFHLFGNKMQAYDEIMTPYIKGKMDEKSVVGASIAVVSGGRIVYMRGFGFADKEAQKPVTPYTLFRLASVTKPFTCLAIMQLAEKGLIDIDMPVDRYIPNFDYKSLFSDDTPVTVRMLMTHQSGLISDKYYKIMTQELPMPSFRTLVDFYKEEYVSYPSRYMSAYCNGGFALLGVIIENVTGLKYEDYMKYKVLYPLRMAHSRFDMYEYMEPYMAKPYSLEGEYLGPIYFRDIPAGGLVSNAYEMTRFMRSILKTFRSGNSGIVKKKTLMKMIKQQNSDIPTDYPEEFGTKWGLGWTLGESVLNYSGRVIGHLGGLPGYLTSMQFNLDYDIGVIVMTNSDQEGGAYMEMADQAMLKALEIFKGVVKEESSGPVPAVLSEAQMELMVGSYATNELGIVKVSKDDNSLIFTLSNVNFQIVPYEDGWFSFAANGAEIPGLRFSIREINGEKLIGVESLLDFGFRTQSPFGVEYKAPETPSWAWLDRVGNYTILNPDYSLPSDTPIQILSVSDNTLYVVFGSDPPAVLLPLNDTLASRLGRGRNINETIRVTVDDDGEILNFCGYKFRKIEVSENRKSGIEMTKEISVFSFDTLRNRILNNTLRDY